MSLIPISSRGSSPGPDTNTPLIELIYAGVALAGWLLLSAPPLTNCICGSITIEPEDPANHHSLCPVGRFYRAVEAVKEGVL